MSEGAVMVGPAPARRESVSPSAFARVEAHASPEPILAAWAELEAIAPCSVYQTRAWLLPWVETLGRRAGITPLYVLARDAEDGPVALLCLGLQKRGPLCVATWLGGKDSNFNLALVRPDRSWAAADVTRLLQEAARAFGDPRPDLMLLPSQPFAWAGRRNPLALAPHQASPSAAYGTSLPHDAEAFFSEKLSKDSRKKLRKKEAKLAVLGPVTHRIAHDIASRTAMLDAFLAQKIERFEKQRIVSSFAAPEMRAFIEAASAPSGQGIELHALCAGERILAVYGGAAHNSQWSGMFNSFDSDEEIAKSSPGDLLLQRIAAKACADGLTHLDLGIGEARYKAALCDEEIPLFDTIVPVTLRGRAVAHAIAASRRLKGVVKANPRLLRLARRIRYLSPA